MKEIDAIIAEVKDALAAKRQEIKNAGKSAIPYVTEAFKTRQMEVCTFELMNSNMKAENRHNHFLITQCEHDAMNLLGEISRIRV